MTRGVFEPDRWLRIEELFSAALEVPDTQRPDWLESACGGDGELRSEVESLLAEDARMGSGTGVGTRVGTIIGRVASSIAAGENSDSRGDVKPGTQIGPWRIERPLGAGGMGTVWLATRTGEDFIQVAALKLLQGEIASRVVAGRFAQERRILAGLKHPHIASFIDGGATRSQGPYFVMEYVDGEPITDFADALKLSVDARLELFLKVCDAVRYAHQRMVIHRDIKPSNILVTQDGTPKLLDFGIAKLLDTGLEAENLAATSATMRMYTPDYASPEQVRGEPVSAATDVYQLGAVLYQLLTGCKPHRLTRNDPVEIARSICETAVTAPRSHNRHIAADLEIVMFKSLAKESARRYQSVEEFSGDIRRYRAGQPITARRDSLLYRGMKFARRHWLPLAAASLGLTALVAGVVLSLESARRAEHRFQQVRKLANHFLVDFDQEIRQVPGTTRARALLVATALEYLDSLAKEAGGDGDLQFELAGAYQNIGDVQGMTGMPNLGRPRDALISYHKSVDIMRRLHERSPAIRNYTRALALCLERQSFLQIFTGDKDGARRGLQEALSLMQNSIRNQKPEARELRVIANGYVYLSELEIGESNGVAAVAAARDGVDWMKRNLQANPILRSRSDLARSYGQLGSVQMVRGDLEGALPNLVEEVSLRRVIEREAPQHTENLREMAMTLLNLEDLYGGAPHPNLQRPGVALGYCRQAMTIFEKLAAADRQNVSAFEDLSNVYGTLADLTLQSDARGALTLYRKSIAMADSLPPGSAEEARDLRAKWTVRMSYALLAVRDVSGARKAASEALAARLKVAGDRPGETASRRLSSAYLALGNAEFAGHDPGAAREHLTAAAKVLEPFQSQAEMDVDLAADLALTWEALERFPDERAGRRAQRLRLWQGWSRSLPSSFTRSEEVRAGG